jgi:hypothetical protein
VCTVGLFVGWVSELQGGSYPVSQRLRVFHAKLLVEYNVILRLILVHVERPGGVLDVSLTLKKSFPAVSSVIESLETLGIHFVCQQRHDLVSLLVFGRVS